MKRLFFITATSICCFFLLFNLFHTKLEKKIITNSATITPNIIEEDEANEDGIFQAQQQEFELTKDISLGYIPKDRLVRAYQNLMTKRRLSPNTPSSVSALTWSERGPNSDAVGPSNGNTRAGSGVTSGRIRAIWVDLSDASNHTVWVGGVDGGIWKTTDISASPATWTPVNDFLSNLAIGSICQDPLGTKDTMYFGTGEKTANADAVRGGGIWKTVDHGVTWNLLPSSTSIYNVSKIIVDASGNVYVATIGNSKGIQRSTDGGTTWTNITPSGLNNKVTDMKLSSTG
ncbi:MAG: WD40/YVTN/BNR-like repeat-containing protein, partial [Ginsengibacter sp.]